MISKLAEILRTEDKEGYRYGQTWKNVAWQMGKLEKKSGVQRLEESWKVENPKVEQLRAGVHEARQQQLAAQTREDGRQVEATPWAAPGAVDLPVLPPGEGKFVFVHVAQGHQPRQQSGAALAQAQEGLARAATGAPGRQQNRGPGPGPAAG